MSAQNPNLDQLHTLLGAGNTDQLSALFRAWPPADTGRLVTRLDEKQQRQLLTLLPADDAAQLLKELPAPEAAQLLATLSAEQAAALVELFPSNEQADLLAELGEDGHAILAAPSTETALRVRRLSEHQADTAGGLMVAEFLSYLETSTVGDVIEDLLERLSLRANARPVRLYHRCRQAARGRLAAPRSAAA